MNRIKNAGLVLLTAYLTGCSGEETMPELT